MTKLNFTDLTIARLKHPETGQERHFDTQLPGFGITVGKNTKTFIVVTGTNRKMKTLGRYPAVSLKTARQAAKQLLADPSSSKPTKTYSEAVLAFLAARKPHLKLKTYQVYTYYLNKLDFKLDMNELTKTDINRKLAIFDGKNRAQNACFAALRTFLNWCMQEEILDHHPIFRARVPNKTTSRSRVLTDTELVDIWNAATFKPYGNIIRMLMLTGARRNEIRFLQVDGNYLHFKDTKNGTDHNLPITPLVREHLLGEYSFNNWQRSKEKLDKLSGVKGYRVHDLRRTWATNAAKLGIRPEVIERVLNHKQTGIQEVYQRYHYMPEIENALLTVEAHLQTILKPRASTPKPSTTSLIGVRDETARKETAPR